MKIKHGILICLFCLNSFNIIAQINVPDSFSGIIPEPQRRDIDSLKRLLQKAGNDRDKVDFLNRLAGKYASFLFDSAFKYASQAKILSEKIGFAKGTAMALQHLGSTFEYNQKNWITALDYYKQSVAIREKNNLYDDLHEGYSNLLNCYFYLGDFPNAMTVATKGLASAKRKNDQDKLLSYNSLIGEIYLRQNNFNAALSYYLNSLQMAEHIKREEQSGLVFLGLADVAIAMHDSVNSFHYLKEARKKFDPIFTKPDHPLRHKLPFTYYKLGLAFNLFGNKDSALDYVLKAIQYATLVPSDKFDVANYYLLAGDVYRQLKDFDRAKEYLYRGLAIAKEIKHKEDTRDAYGFLVKIFAEEKRFDSAWNYSQLHIALKDSIINERSRYHTDEIKAIYDIREKDKEIARQSNIRNIIVGSFIVLLISLGFLYNRYRLRQKNRHQQQLNLQQNELFNAIAVTQDKERKRIAEDIHDSLGSILSAAKLKLSSIKESHDTMTQEQLEKYQITMQLLDEASTELRNISHNIMPATLSKLGLVAALRNLINNISSHSGMQVSFSAHDFTERIDEKTEMSIYRIVLELINNIVKHASATKVTVQLIRYPDYINLSVEDNGHGFDYEGALQEKKGIGLGNILSRVDYLKGKMDVDTMAGRGTTVIIDIPYKAG